MVKWDDAYSTGIAVIDDQHKRLFQYVNDLEGAVQEQDVSNALLLRIFDFFEEYAKIHFGNEETCMHRYKCPIAQTNKAAHQRFIETYNYYKELLRKEGASYQLFHAFLTWAQEWLVQHICKIDTQLKPCVEEGSTSEKTGTKE